MELRGKYTRFNMPGHSGQCRRCPVLHHIHHESNDSEWACAARADVAALKNYLRG